MKYNRTQLAKAREEFESWVNNPCMTDESDSPESWGGTKATVEKWELSPYEHPWTAGAWEAWKYFNGLPSERGE